MKKIGRIVLVLALSIGAAVISRAQNTADLAKFLNTSQQGQDASKLIGAYAAPVVRAVSYGMTGGWYHTGKVHKKFGVDLGASINLAFIPTAENYFNPASLGLSANTSFNGNATNPNQGAPTFVGPKDATSYTTHIGGQPVVFNGPEGLDLKKNLHFEGAPVPMIQLGIGLLFGTDLKVRYAKLNKSGSKFNMLGFGLMHDIKQHIPGIKLLPFDLSVLAAYNSVSGSTDLSSGPNASGRPESTNGMASYKFNSWVVQAVISKKVSVLTGYLGVGYGSITTNVDVTGTFNLGLASVSNPVSMKIGTSSPKVTAGLRLKLGPIYLVGDYTLQKYNVLSVGLGVSIR